jgi:phosphatidylglycerol:prolipoprotein diacylglycerol transferase
VTGDWVTSPPMPVASISYPPIPIFEIGPLRLSLHGLMAGVGFVVGALLMIREARRRGFDEAKVTSMITWGLVGSILGARLFTIPAHLNEGLVEAIKPFGTFSIMGGFAGGIIAGGWRMSMLKVSVIAHMDMAAFGLAVGTVVGRMGDLFIVEHLGGKTSFFLGYLLKPGYDVAPQHDYLEFLCNTKGECGPYHFAALYDLLGAAVLLGLLYLLARRWKGIRYGVLIFTWAAWYGLQRFLIDFTRNTDLPNADATAGPFTWNQWVGLLAGLAAIAVLEWIILARRTPVVTPEQDAAYGAVTPAAT